MTSGRSATRPTSVWPSTVVRVSYDAWSATRRGTAALADRRRRRLAHLVALARSRSPFYAERLRGLPTDVRDVRQLPVVTKAQMMDDFDSWVCDPAITRAGVEEFIADPGRVGESFLGRYTIWTTSGTTGVPAVLVQDRAALAVYTAVSVVRGYVASSAPSRFVRDVAKVAWRGGRVATVVVTGGHHGGAVMVARAHRRHPRLAGRNRLFSVLEPVPTLVSGLNAFRPSVLHGYPSALALLAAEQTAGRLHLDPVLMGSMGETLTAPVRRRIESAFGCSVRDAYGSSEAGGIAFECAERRLHVNTDWVILEPVDQHHDPVPPDVASHTVLVTNLANRVQPIIRYDLGDSVTWHRAPCQCGSPLPVITVEGRGDEVLTLPGRDRDIHLLPLALATVAEDTPGLRRVQLIKTGAATLTIRFEPVGHADPDSVWQMLRQRVAAHLADQGAADTALVRSADPPASEASGKYRTVKADRPS